MAFQTLLVTVSWAIDAANNPFRVWHNHRNPLILEERRGLDRDVPHWRSLPVFRTIKLDMTLEESTNRFIVKATRILLYWATLNETLPDAFNCICLLNTPELQDVTKIWIPVVMPARFLTNRQLNRANGIRSRLTACNLDDFDGYSSHNREGQTLRIHNRFNYFHFVIQ